MTSTSRLARFARRIGRRGAWLLFLAFVDLLYGLGLPELLRRPTSGLAFLTSLLPAQVWAGLWVAVAAACLIQAFVVRDRVAFSAGALLMMLWGMFHLVGWLLIDVPRGQIGAAIFLAFAGVTLLISGWRENWER